MATDMARSNSSSIRHLWQAPIFLIGVGTLVAVILLRPYFSTNTIFAAQHQLAEARKSLEQSPPDLNDSIQRGMRVLSATDRFPQLAGEAHFVIGSAQLRLSDGASTDAATLRQQARQHLELADREGVPEADLPKLQYRLAKVHLMAGEDPKQCAAALEKSVEADDPTEGYGLLALAYSRMNPPDHGKALEVAAKQLERSIRGNDPRGQAMARYRLGELNFQLKNVKDARLMLSRVGTEAPADQYFAARTLLAESYEETQEWANAARNWDKARENPKATGPEKAKILYRLGQCYARDQRPNDAVPIFEEAQALGGEEGQAAAIRRAELKATADPAAAVEAIASALKSVTSAEAFRNPLISADDVRQIIERAGDAARAKADWNLAKRTAEVYARIAKAGRDDEMAAKNLESEAKSLEDQAKNAAVEQAVSLDARSRELYEQAAAAYERAADKVVRMPELAALRSDWLWQCAHLNLKVGQTSKVQEILVQVTQAEGVAPERQAEAWYFIGTTFHRSQQYANARTAYQRCAAFSGLFADKGKLGLAEVDLTESRFDEAENGLQELLKSIRESSQPNPEIQEQATYALARVAYARQSSVKEELREYATAEQRLLGAIQQYPNSQESPNARRFLALCYWMEARVKNMALSRNLSEDEQRAYFDKKRELLQKAVEQFDKAEEFLLERQRAGAISPAEAQCLKEVSYWGAECVWYLNNYSECARRNGALALRYQGKPEEMIALSQVWQCYVHMREPDKAKAVVKRMEEAMVKIPPAAFNGTLATHHRDYWERWLVEANKAPLAATAQPTEPK